MQRTETLQFIRTLQRHDNADEKRDEGNDGKRLYADGHGLMKGALETEAAFQRGHEGVG